MYLLLSRQPNFRAEVIVDITISVDTAVNFVATYIVIKNDIIIYPSKI